jgi:hypothetical protein
MRRDQRVISLRAVRHVAPHRDVPQHARGRRLERRDVGFTEDLLAVLDPAGDGAHPSASGVQLRHRVLVKRRIVERRDGIAKDGAGGLTQRFVPRVPREALPSGVDVKEAALRVAELERIRGLLRCRAEYRCQLGAALPRQRALEQLEQLAQDRFGDA